MNLCCALVLMAFALGASPSDATIETGPVARTTVSGAEIPFHHVVETFLATARTLRGDEDLDWYLGAAGFRHEWAATGEVPKLLDGVEQGYLERVRAASSFEESEAASCWKVREIGARLAALHREIAATGAPLGWRTLLQLIDGRVRPSVSLHSTGESEEFWRSQRMEEQCWADGVHSVYPDAGVAP